MDSAAVRCPSCGKLRKDIYNDKIKCYIFCLIGGFAIGFSIFNMKGHRQNDLENFYNAGNSSGNSLSTVLLIVGILAAIGGIYYWWKVSQQLKTYWWS
jgi:hypothetical protein